MKTTGHLRRPPPTLEELSGATLMDHPGPLHSAITAVLAENRRSDGLNDHTPVLW